MLCIGATGTLLRPRRALLGRVRMSRLGHIRFISSRGVIERLAVWLGLFAFGVIVIE